MIFFRKYKHHFLPTLIKNLPLRCISSNTTAKLREVGLFTTVKQEGNYETGQVCYLMMDKCQEYSIR
ncbi:unnamed protein product [Adineta ricciae]|uniref:Uncharacterized protein n=1 Tax=Adineta ricciae TaxID=249248 RepID=A0A814KRH3_ADIRI|nr:unnamed protein product [Adineta ricciae]